MIRIPLILSVLLGGCTVTAWLEDGPPRDDDHPAGDDDNSAGSDGAFDGLSGPGGRPRVR